MQVIYVHGVSDRPYAATFKQRLLRRERRFEKRVASKLQQRITKFRDASWGDLVPLITISGTVKLSAQTGAAVSDTAEFDAEALRRPDGKFDAADLVEAAAMQGTLTEQEVEAVEDAVERLAEDGVVVSPAKAESPVQALMREMRRLMQHHDEARDNLFYLKTIEVLERRIERPAEETLRRLRGRDYLAHQLASRWKDAIYYVGHGRREITKHVFDIIRAETAVADSDPVVLIGHSLGALVCWDVLHSEEFRDRGLAKDRKWIFLALGSQLQSYQELQIIPTLKLAPHLANVRWRHIRDTGDPLSFPIDDAANEVVCKTGQNWANAHTSYLDNDKVLDAVQTALSDILREWGMSLQEHGESSIDAQVLSAAAPALHVFIVAIGDYEVEALPLPCAVASAQMLADFWQSCATGAGPFLPDEPLGSVSILHVAVDAQGHIDQLMQRLEACFRLVRTGDTAIVHWIGHGEIDDTNTQYLLLSRELRFARGMAERAGLLSVIDWFALSCGATRQFFFFDCCGLRKAGSHLNEWLVLGHLVNPRLRQMIYVGSGLGQAALAHSGGVTFFTESFIQAVSLHPVDQRRRVFVGGALIDALAGGVLQRLVAGTHPLPDEYDLQHNTWREKLVRMEQAPTPSHRANGNFSLGTAQAAEVGTCILTKPSGAHRLPVHHEPSNLTAYSYKGVFNVEAFVGNASEGTRFKLKFGAGTGSEMIIESGMILPFVQDWKSA